MIQYINNNDAYGMTGPFEAESLDAAVAEMEASGIFKQWAEEKWDNRLTCQGDVGKHLFIAAEIERMREEYRAGLEVVE
jgi:hypothetical protein